MVSHMSSYDNYAIHSLNFKDNDTLLDELINEDNDPASVDHLFESSNNSSFTGFNASISNNNSFHNDHVLKKHQQAGGIQWQGSCRSFVVNDLDVSDPTESSSSLFNVKEKSERRLPSRRGGGANLPRLDEKSNTKKNHHQIEFSLLALLESSATFEMTSDLINPKRITDASLRCNTPSVQSGKSSSITSSSSMMSGPQQSNQSIENTESNECLTQNTRVSSKCFNNAFTESVVTKESSNIDSLKYNSKSFSTLKRRESLCLVKPEKIGSSDTNYMKKKIPTLHTFLGKKSTSRNAKDFALLDTSDKCSVSSISYSAYDSEDISSSSAYDCDQYHHTIREVSATATATTTSYSFPSPKNNGRNKLGISAIGRDLNRSISLMQYDEFTNHRIHCHNNVLNDSAPKQPNRCRTPPRNGLLLTKTKSMD